ncbi:MAG: 2-dehydro-3-deoxygalactonokinase [Bacteroidota bacterium]
MKRFLSCDWGTTTFRLRLIDAVDCAVIAEERNRQGIADTYAAWKQTNSAIETRPAFYLSIIDNAINKIETKLNTSLVEIPLVISGMASANIGMIELPYAMLPFSIDGSGLVVHNLPATKDFAHNSFIISGARDTEDVMRGEETQLVGVAAIASQEKQLFIFPGTHSKHIIVKNKQAISVKTYMSGEFFELLSKKSVLALSIEQGDDSEAPLNKQAFEKGVKDSLLSDLLHHSFLVRTNDLFHSCTKQENYYYLSGLLIGTELNKLTDTDFDHITVVANEALSNSYSLVFAILNIKNTSFVNVDEAIVKGQQIILTNKKLQ